LRILCGVMIKTFNELSSLSECAFDYSQHSPLVPRLVVFH